MRTQIDANGTLVYFVAHGVCDLTETTRELEEKVELEGRWEWSF
jgi:hypothetical protein